MGESKTVQEYFRENCFAYKCTQVRGKCRKKDIPFDLTPEYLESIWTGSCPVFHTKLLKPFHSTSADRTSKHTSSLDRIVPDRGYVRGNVEWISNYANSIKQTATADELQRVANHVAMREKELAQHEAD